MSTGKTYSTKYLLDSNNNRGAEGQVLSSTNSGIDWVTLSEISGVDGTGTANYLSKWLDANTITNSLVYDNGTNVGIGTTSPANKLHVEGGNIQLSDNQHITWGYGGNNAIYGNNTSDFINIFTNGSERLRINASGKVGIGTTNPSAKLELVGTYGNTKLDGHFIGFTRASANYLWASATGGDLRFTVNGNAIGSPSMIINTSGNVGIGTVSPEVKLHVGAASLGTNGDTNADIISSGGITIEDGRRLSFDTDYYVHANIRYNSSNPVTEARLEYQGHYGHNFITRSSSKMVINGNTGNVGIGTTSPTDKLTIQQTSDGSGVKILGFDDESGESLHLSIQSSGNSRLNATRSINIYSGDSYGGGIGSGSITGVTWDAFNQFKFTAESNARIPLSIEGAVSQVGDLFNITSNGGSAGDLLTVDSSGNVGIGTTNPNDQDLSINAPKLHVVGPSTTGAFNLVARFQGGNDNNNTGAAILINHSNDRGLLINAGRADSDREVAYFNLVSSGAVVTNVLTLRKVGSYHNAGIGVEDPDAKLEIKGSSSGTSAYSLRVRNSSNTEFFSVRDDGVTTVTNNYFYVHASQGAYVQHALRVRGSLSNDVGTLIIGNSNNTSFNGDVGIGVTNPARKLTLANGHFRLTDLYRVEWGGSDVRIDGSNASDFLRFYTADTERMRITSAGNVGIGTASPNTKLHVEGDTPIIQIRETSGAAEAGISINHSTNGEHYNWFVGTLDGSSRKLTIGATVTDGWATNTAQAAASLMLIDQSTGNVGIGTTGPSTRLHVYEAVNRTTAIVQNNNHTARFEAYGTATAIDTTASNGVFIRQNGSNRAHFAASGNVGIGIDSPTYKLQVRSLDANDDVAYIHHDNASQTSGTVLKVRSDAGDSSGYSLLDVQNNTGNVLYVRGDRRVGIRTTAPDRPLHVIGQFAIDNSTSPSGGLLVSPEGDSNKVYSRTGNANTTAHPLDFISGSSTSMRIAANGDVGIGTAGPTEKLEVTGGKVKINKQDEALVINAIANNGSYILLTNSTTPYAYIGAANQIITAGTATQLGLRSQSDILFATNGLPERMRITSAGNVGIGTTSPSQELEVGGTVLANDYRGSSHIYLTSPDSWIFRSAAGTERMKVDSAGSLLLGNTTAYQRVIFDPTPSTVLGNGSLTITPSTAPGSGTSQFYTRFLDRTGGGITKHNVIVDGKVCIGTTSADKPLTINSDTAHKAIRILENDSGNESWDIGVDVYGSFNFFNSADTSPTVTFSDGGNVGIGTTSPSDRLHIKNDDASGNNSRCDIRVENGLGYSEFGTLSGYARIQSNGTEAAAINRGASYFYTDYGLFGAHLTAADSGDGVLGINGGGGTGGEAYLKLMRANVSGFILNHTASAIQVRATANIPMFFYTNDTIGIKLNANSTVSFPEYGAGTLVTDASGNITVSSGGGAGGPYLPLAGGTMNSGAAITFTVPSSGGNFININHTGNEAWTIGAQSGSGVDDYLDIGISGGTRAMSWHETGRVGIGTTNPSQKLDVGAGHIRLDAGYSLQWDNSHERIEQSDANLEFFVNNGQKVTIDSDGLDVNGITTSSGFRTDTSNTDYNLITRNSAGNAPLYVQSANTNTNQQIAVLSYGSATANAGTKVLVVGKDKSYFDNTNLGIGTSNPTEKLHVNGNIELKNNSHIGSLDGSYWQRIRFEDATPSTTNAFNFETRNGSGSYIKHMVIRNDGNVGIGVTNPSYALQVGGSIVGTSKNFIIDHPTKEGKKLLHACIEGPEAAVYFRGKSTSNIIEMPDYWVGLVDIDTMTVDITAIGPNQDLYVEDISDDGEVTVGSNTEQPLNYFYVVYGERKDIGKLDIEVIDAEYSDESTD